MKTDLNKNATLYFLLLLLISIGVFSLILVYNRNLYEAITYEDRFVEYLGFIFLLVAGFYVLRSSILGLRKNVRTQGMNSFLLIVGIVFVIAAFEEISRGQRIFGFGTPERLMEINRQQEFNFHNIDKKFFDRVLDRANILFVLFSTVMLILKKDHLLGIKLPDVHLTLAFAIIPFYHQYNEVSLDFYHILYLPIAIIAVRAAMQKKRGEVVAATITILMTFVLLWLHRKYNHHFPLHNNSANEIKETLFSLVCAYYAFVIFRDTKALTEGQSQ